MIDLSSAQPFYFPWISLVPLILLLQCPTDEGILSNYYPQPA